MTTAIAPTQAKPEKLIVHDQGPLSHIFDTAKFEQLQRVCRMLACSTLTPRHLCGKTAEETMANCFRVSNQALRWQMDPFAVADETYVVQGRLGYQGKLVAAVVNTRAGLDGRLSYSYAGTGDNRTVTVSGTFKDDGGEVKTITLSVGQARTKNEMWTKDPDQKLAYSGAIKWARRFCPEVVMGVLTDDDVQRIAERETIEAPKNISAIIQNLSEPRLATDNSGDKLTAGTDADDPQQSPDDDAAMAAEAYAREQAEAGELFGKGKDRANYD